MTSKIPVNYRIIDPRCKIPERSTEGAAYYDVFTVEGKTLEPGDIHMFATGLIITPMPGYFIDLRPRSGLSLKGITLANSPGVIDSDYYGELKCILINHSNKHYVVKQYDRIAQMAAFPISEISFRDRTKYAKETSDHAGFGSTGA